MKDIINRCECDCIHEDIVGKVNIRIYPLDRIGSIK